MNKNKTLAYLIGAFCLSSAITTTAYAKEPQNLFVTLKGLIQYHDSGNYAKDQQQVMDKAQHYLQQQISQHKNTDKLAVVLDIDETSLSNYPDMHTMNFGGTLKQIIEAECEGKDPAIEPTLKLYKLAKENHVAVFFITGRTNNCEDSTIKNLEQAGYKDWDGLYMKPDDYNQPSVVPFKAGMREEIEKKGYTIIINIGDQQSDLAGGHSKKTYKLPNPYYFIP